MTERDIARVLRRSLRRLSYATTLLYVAVAVALLLIWHQTNTTKKENRQTTTALCALRGDLAHRVQTSTDFLKAHPQGIPGISVSIIKSGIVSSQQSIHALGGLTCP